MYEYQSKDYAAEFFINQENLKTARSNRAIAEATERRAQSVFSRQQEVQAIADKTLQTLGDISRGTYSTTQKATEELAMDALAGNKGMPGFNDNPVSTSSLDDLANTGILIDEKPRTIKTEPLDISLGTMADAVGNALMKAGYAAEGMAYVKEGVEYANKMAEAEQKRVKAEIEKAKSFTEVANFIYEGLADVRSQDEQDAFFRSLPQSMIEILGVDNVKQMVSMPYTPEVIEHYREKALSVKETYDLSLRAEAQQLTADRDAARVFDQAARRKIAEQRLQDARNRDANKDKSSGKNAPIVAQPAAIGQARNKIVAEVFKGVMPAKGTPDAIILDSAAASIASEAVQMAKDNPGLTYDQALVRSVTLHRGDFLKPMKDEDISLIDRVLGKTPGKVRDKSKPIQYKPAGSSKDKPIILKTRPADGKLVPGNWYSFGGRTMQYNPE